MRRIMPYLLLSLFSVVFIYESLEVFIAHKSVCHVDFESKEKEKESESEKSEKNEKKEAKSEFEEDLYLSLLCRFNAFNSNQNILYTNHLRSAVNYRKAVYSPPEFNSIA